MHDRASGRSLPAETNMAITHTACVPGMPSTGYLLPGLGMCSLQACKHTIVCLPYNMCCVDVACLDAELRGQL
jgi:hypothetical protein